MNVHSLWVPCIAGAALVACTQSYDDFSFNGAQTPTGTATAVGGTGGIGGSAGSTPQGGGGTGGVGGSAGSTPQGGGGTGGVGGDGGGGATSPDTVLCDGTECDVSSGGFCCEPRYSGTPSCEASGSCNVGYYPIYCDGPEDCPGQICCGDFGMGGYSILECVDDCGAGNFVVCHPSTANCAGTTQCLASDYLPTGYFVCKEP